MQHSLTSPSVWAALAPAESADPLITLVDGERTPGGDGAHTLAFMHGKLVGTIWGSGT